VEVSQVRGAAAVVVPGENPGLRNQENKMSNLINHAKKEFQLAGWLDEPVDEMQQMIMDNLLELLETFSNQGH